MDGATHHAITSRKATLAAAQHDGPVYLRLSRADVPNVHPTDFVFHIGKGVVLRPGSEVTLVGTGVMVGRCLDAAEALAGDGISARVIEIHTLKPIDGSILEQAAHETGAIVTVEEHSVIGGLGSAVAEVVGECWPVPVVRVGLPDVFAETGPFEQVLDKFGMSVQDIVSAANQALRLRDGRASSIPIQGLSKGNHPINHPLK